MQLVSPYDIGSGRCWGEDSDALFTVKRGLLVVLLWLRYLLGEQVYYERAFELARASRKRK
jgi:hypothetical protein